LRCRKVRPSASVSACVRQELEEMPKRASQGQHHDVVAADRVTAHGMAVAGLLARAEASTARLLVCVEAWLHVRTRSPGVPGSRRHRAVERGQNNDEVRAGIGQRHQGGGGTRRRRGDQARGVVSGARECRLVAAYKVFCRMPKGTRRCPVTPAASCVRAAALRRRSRR